MCAESQERTGSWQDQSRGSCARRGDDHSGEGESLTRATCGDLREWEVAMTEMCYVQGHGAWEKVRETCPFPRGTENLEPENASACPALLLLRRPPL